MKPTNVIATVSQLMGILAVVYGFFWIRNFKKQERIKSQASSAYLALQELSEVKIALVRIGYGADSGERQTALWEYLPVHLIKLQSALLLLRRAPQIEEKIVTLQRITKLAFDYKVHKASPGASNVVNQIYDMLGWQPESGVIETGFLSELGESLIRIYELNDII